MNNNNETRKKSFPNKLRLKTKRERSEIQNAYKVRQDINDTQAAERIDRFENHRWTLLRTFYENYVQPQKSSVAPSAFEEACALRCITEAMPILHLEEVVRVIYKVDLSNIEVHSALTSAFRALDVDNTDTVDYRIVVYMISILQQPYLPLQIRLVKWFDTFKGSESKLSSKALLKMLLIISDGSEEVESITSHYTLKKKDVTKEEWEEFLSDKKQSGRLLALLDNYCWHRALEEHRVAYYKKNYFDSIETYKDAKKSYRMAQAVAYWKFSEHRSRFCRWKSYYYLRLKVRKAHCHWIMTEKAKTIRRFASTTRRVQWMKHHQIIASKKYYHFVTCRMFNAWHFLYTCSKEKQVIALTSALYVRNFHLMQKAFEEFVTHLEERREEARTKAQHLDDAFIGVVTLFISRHYRGWRDHVKLVVEERNAMERHKEWELRMKEAEIADRNIELMTFEDTLSTAVRNDEYAAADEERIAIMKERTDEVFRRRKKREQRHARVKWKADREVQRQKDADVFWEGVTEKALIETKKKTEKWLKWGEGKAELDRMANDIYEEDPSLASDKLQADPTDGNIPDCEWQQMIEEFGGKHALAYFFNTKTCDKIKCTDLTEKDCKMIAKAQIHQIRITKMLETIKAKAEAEVALHIQDVAATRIQMMFLCRKALKKARGIMKSIMVRRIDAISGELVYFNIRTRVSSKEPPYIMGTRLDTLSTESTSWIRRVDPQSGNPYYMNIETEETCTEAPLHYIVCVKCKFNLVTRRCNETGERYCLSCYALGLHNKDSFGTDKPATWTKIPVQPAKCIVCRKALADKLCHECGGDTLCRRCFTAVHKNPRIKNHSRVDIIGNP